jgi:hypothetical protein
VSTSVSTSSDSNRDNSKQNRSVRRWVTAGSVVVVLFLLFIIIRTQGSVSGTEFSPSHFQLRSFSFYELPLIHVQLTPIKRTGKTPKTATYVRQTGLIKPATGTPTTWHLVSLSRGISGETPADANLLIEHLNLRSVADDYWRQWSIDHPKLAKILWPKIQTLAERELYILMPKIFEFAMDEDNHVPLKLQTKIDDYLKNQYLTLVHDMQDANRGELAKQLLVEAKADYPQSADLKNLQLSPQK